MATGQPRGKYGIEFRGMAELMGKLGPNGAVEKRVLAAGTQGMIEVCEDLLGRAMREAPLDEGTLRGSGTTAIYVDGRRVSAGSRAPQSQGAV